MELVLLALKLAADFATTNGVAQAKVPERVAIRVENCQGGSYEQRELVISRGPIGFSDGNRPLDDQLIAALVASATRPPVEALEPASIAVSAKRLRVAAQKRVAGQPPRAGARFVERASDPRNLPELIRALYESEWTDDYPSVSVEISFRGGAKLKLSSRAQHPLMLPWQVAGAVGSYRTYAPAISRAVANLLPPKFLNRDRLAGERLVEHLVETAEMKYRDDLEREGADEQLGAQIDPIRRRFEIDSSRVGSELSFSVHGENVWNAKLSARELGAIRFQLYVTANGARLASVEPFLRDAEGLVHRVRALTWLSKYLAANPRAWASIEYYDDHSLSLGAQADVIRDLEHAGHAKLGAAIAPDLDRSIGLCVSDGGRRFAIWIVLPDGRSVLDFGDSVPDSLAARPGTVIATDGAVVDSADGNKH